jgi:hypothetical protein
MLVGLLERAAGVAPEAVIGVNHIAVQVEPVHARATALGTVHRDGAMARSGGRGGAIVRRQQRAAWACNVILR